MKTKTLIVFFIFIIILGSSNIAILAEVLSYGAFRDNLENADNIQVLKQVIVNQTLDCIELNITSTSLNKEYEVFNVDWTEQDILNRLTQTANESRFTVIQRDDDNIYLQNDTGAQTLSEFTHEFNIKVTALADNMATVARCVALAYSTALGDRAAVLAANEEELGIRLNQNQSAPVKFSLQLEEITNGASSRTNKTLPLNLNRLYYCKILKYGTGVILRVYNNSVFTDLICATKLTLGNNQTYRYIMCPQSNDANFKDNDWATGKIGNLWIGRTSGGDSDYFGTGHFYTKDIMTGLNGQAVCLQTLSTLGGGTITIEFSDDNVTYESTRTLTGGNESQDIRGLEYLSNCYLRGNLTKDGTTPRLYQIILITDSNGVTPTPTTETRGFYIAIGIIIATAFCYLMMRSKNE